MAKRKAKSLKDRRKRRLRYQAGDELSAAEKSEQYALGLKEASSEARMEGYDDKTERRAIRMHERAMRRKFRKSDAVDPLASERRRADRRGVGTGAQKIVESGTPMFAMPGEEKYGVKYMIEDYTSPRDIGRTRSRTEQLSEKAARYKARRERNRDRVKDKKDIRAKRKYLRKMPKGAPGTKEKKEQLRGRARDARQRPTEGLFQRIAKRCKGSQCRRDQDAGKTGSAYKKLGGFGKVKRRGGMKKCKHGC